MILILGGPKDFKKGPLEQINSRLSQFYDTKLIELESPSKASFSNQRQKIRDEVQEETIILAYCFTGTLILNLQSNKINSKIVIDPPSGIIDSGGEVINPDFPNSEKLCLIASNSFNNKDIPEKVIVKNFSADHWFSNKENELIKEIDSFLRNS